MTSPALTPEQWAEVLDLCALRKEVLIDRLAIYSATQKETVVMDSQGEALIQDAQAELALVQQILAA